MTNEHKKLSVDKISQIVELTQEDRFRPEIARLVGVSEATVYKYQRLFELI